MSVAILAPLSVCFASSCGLRSCLWAPLVAVNMGNLCQASWRCLRMSTDLDTCS